VPSRQTTPSVSKTEFEVDTNPIAHSLRGLRLDPRLTYASSASLGDGTVVYRTRKADTKPPAPSTPGRIAKARRANLPITDRLRLRIRRCAAPGGGNSGLSAPAAQYRKTAEEQHETARGGGRIDLRCLADTTAIAQQDVTRRASWRIRDRAAGQDCRDESKCERLQHSPPPRDVIRFDARS